MKIHFDASGRGLDLFRDNYVMIEKLIQDLGHENLNHVFDMEVVEQFYEGPHSERVERYKKLMESLKKSELVILEVSVHSLSMGYWLQKAMDLNKSVIALYLKDYEPKFLEGVEDEKLQIIEYSADELESILKLAIENAAGVQDTRFNFFISPKHQNYLDWIAKYRKIPRSVFLRRLIEDHMKSNDEYKS